MSKMLQKLPYFGKNIYWELLKSVISDIRVGTRILLNDFSPKNQAPNW